MPRFLPRALCCLSLAFAATSFASGGEIKTPDDAPKPFTPAESLAMFEVEPGFRVELVAAEPDLAAPVAVTFDAAGRIYACEIHGYNLDGQLDIDELNKTGELDMAVRRIPAPDWAIEEAEKHTYGTVKQMVDENGDGRVDRTTVFADHIPACYGLVAARDGVIAVAAPDIWYLGDVDGDGVAEVKEKLFTGFNEGELWSRTNNPHWGVDNWIYACAGRGGEITVTGPNLKGPVTLGNVNYRFKPDGSAIEPVTGQAGGFGLGLSDWDEHFTIGNSTNGVQVLPIAHRYLARNPHVAAPGVAHDSSTFNNVFPISQPHPWRTKRGEQKAWREFYGEREATPNGYFTAASSPTFYRGGTYPDRFHGNLFCCDSQQNLVHRAIPQRDGNRVKLVRPDDFQNKEFLTSRDIWFRPVNLTTGPDGSFYVVDMYREIIEDYSAIPRYLQQQYGLMNGEDRGRIWRIVSESGPKLPPMNLATANLVELNEAIGSVNAAWRLTAQRLIVERQEMAAVPALEDLATDAGASPEGRLHALYTLHGLGALTSECVTSALDSKEAGLRKHAVALSEPWLDSEPELAKRIVAMATDPDARVRLQVALSLGEMRNAHAIDGLSRLARVHGEDLWLDAAILSSVVDRAPSLLAAIYGGEPLESPARALTEKLISLVAAQGDPAEVAKLLWIVTNFDDSQAARTHLEKVLQGLEQSQATVPDAGPIREPLATLLQSKSADVAILAYRIAGKLGLHDLPEVEQLFAEATKRALDSELELDARITSVELLANAPYERLSPVLEDLLAVSQPPEVQRAAVKSASKRSEAEIAPLLLANWKSHSPEIQEAVLDALFAHRSRVPALLDAIEGGVVALPEITALRRLQLLEHPDDAIRTRAVAALGAQPENADRQALVAEYAKALDQPRDSAHGKEVFLKHCSTCHRVEEQGFEVGPALSSAISRGDEALLDDLLDPSGRITGGFRAYTAVTNDGRVFSGILASESATSITLRRDKGQSDTLLRKDLEELVGSSKSLMPDDLQKSVTPKDIADVLAYLRGVYGSQKTSVVLFDDETGFVDALTEGSGSAELDPSDPFAGSSALVVKPPQKFSPMIPTWEFPIVEAPAAGQYRYLRFAWRVPEGNGTMIELAASGQWPAAASATRRYYSGANETRWQAIEVAPEVPRDWTVVTIDLWKDNGDFVLTGIAPTAMGGAAHFDRIELLSSLEDVDRAP